MWPPEVERIAAFLRASGVEGRLEELSVDETMPPGPAVRSEAFQCDRRTIVAVIPEDRDLDPAKLAAATKCGDPRHVGPARLPYSNASVVVDNLVLAEPVVWLEAGSPGYVVALAPAQLSELTKAATADLVRDA